MPWFGAALEQGQAVPGVGLAEQQILARRKATVAADDVDASVLQGPFGIVFVDKRNDFYFQAQ
ncbi:hypothetical protein D3C72_1477030 [compost metagenome]